MGIVAPIGKDPSPPVEFVPSPVRSGSARITVQLHAYTYIEYEAPLQHHKNTDNDNDNNNTYYNYWDVQGGGGGGGSSHKYKSLWSFTQTIMEYQCGVLSSFHSIYYS